MAKARNKPKPKPSAAMYPKQIFIEQSKQIFGCNPEVVVGALHGQSQAQYTKQEVEQYIENFKNGVVK
ncbi:hypothetical protein VQL36_11520 [Chengkuizengella sp. SCS-71B]|uniref:hypothetical protein n=1 Tax=Chengkuizengella sp. SCS-71B TaxID=3115290 RepID=UPI0032C242FE